MPPLCGHVMPEADEGEEWSGSWHASRQNWITSEWEGSWDRAGMGLHGWRAYKNCLVLPISTRCIFFSVVHSIRTPQLSVLDLEQFWDGWPTRKFPGKRASEDKTHWKDSCWFVGSVGSPKSSLGCYIVHRNPKATMTRLKIQTPLNTTQIHVQMTMKRKSTPTHNLV